MSSSNKLSSPNLTCLCFLRRQQEAELKLVEEETARRVEEAIQKIVKESLDSEEIRFEIQRRLEEGRRRLVEEVAIQLEKEKEAAIIASRQKEVSIFCKSLLLDFYTSESGELC